MWPSDLCVHCVSPDLQRADEIIQTDGGLACQEDRYSKLHSDIETCKDKKRQMQTREQMLDDPEQCVLYGIIWQNVLKHTISTLH